MGIFKNKKFEEWYFLSDSKKLLASNDVLKNTNIMGCCGYIEPAYVEEVYDYDSNKKTFSVKTDNNLYKHVIMTEKGVFDIWSKGA